MKRDVLRRSVVSMSCHTSAYSTTTFMGSLTTSEVVPCLNLFRAIIAESNIRPITLNVKQLSGKRTAGELLTQALACNELWPV